MSELGKVGLRKFSVIGNGCSLPVFLSTMVPGQKRPIDRLPLFKLDEDNHPVPTKYFLQGTLTCKEPGKFFIELRAKFGKNPPRYADIKVYRSEMDPVRMIRNGTPVQVVGLPFGMPSREDGISFLVTTDGSNDAPKNLFAVIKNVPQD